MKIIWEEKKRKKKIEKKGLELDEMNLELLMQDKVLKKKEDRLMEIGELKGMIIIEVILKKVGQEEI